MTPHRTQSGSIPLQQLGLVLARGFETRPGLDPYSENVNVPDLEDRLSPASPDNGQLSVVSLLQASPRSLYWTRRGK